MPTAEAGLTDALVLLASAFGGPSSVAAYADPDAVWSLFSSLDARRFRATDPSSATLAQAAISYYHDELNLHAPLVDELTAIVERELVASPGEDAHTLRVFLETWLNAAIQTEAREEYVAHILTLSEEQQGVLMGCIESFMSSQTPWRDEAASGAASTMSGSGTAAPGAGHRPAESGVELSAAKAEIVRSCCQNNGKQSGVVGCRFIASTTCSQESKSLPSRLDTARLEDFGRVACM